MEDAAYQGIIVRKARASCRFSARKGETQEADAISAVRMPHARDPFRRRFEYIRGWE